MIDPEKDYLSLNRHSWNLRTEVHIGSEFYDMQAFLQGENTLNEIELPLLGDLRGLRVLHLQCHFGQDTLSLARLGAHVTGVDLSDRAIQEARLLAERLGIEADFVCCDLYALPEHLQGQFDVVFSSYGTIGWLPDLERWAQVVAHFLKPGGRFVFAEFHPVVWMFDDDIREVAYRYFKGEAIVENEQGTYADRYADIAHTCVSWNHGLGEVLGSLLRQGLQLSHFQEYDYSPYNCFSGSVQVGPRRYRIGHMGDKLPLVYSLVAERPR